MTYLLLLLIILLNLVCLFTEKKNKLVIFLSVISLSILFAGNNYNADYEAYLLNYELLQTGSSYFKFDILFNGIMILGQLVELKYNDLLMVLCLVAFGVLFTYMGKRYNEHVHLVILFYILYSFFIDVIQVANFFSNILSVLSILCFFDYQKSGNKKFFILALFLLLLAIGIHASALTLLPFFFFKKGKWSKILVVGTIGFACLDGLLKHKIAISIISMIPLLATTSLVNYSNALNSGFGFIYDVIIIGLMLFCIYYVKKNNQWENVENLLLYCLLITPILAISTISYTRLLRVIFLLFAEFYTGLHPLKSKKNLQISLCIIAIYIVMFIREIGVENYLEIMNNNIFI